ncbi:MAG: hypothetical protein M0P91_11205 [Sulfuricurvum sp.]|jgi:hypothetical protein|uniref:hypothetical protein n=1 Tax=Sulfuricurvum sp. TaxID=2025608 RepID=UPI0025E8D881|nr:hypothetical protein [Sulfuricurvum sp.]MCK9373758.1 hypothetical protein [Sulfuricurvum sp.]
MLKINYSKSFDNNIYYTSIANKKFDIKVCKKVNSKCIKKDGKIEYVIRDELKDISLDKNKKTISTLELFDIYKSLKIGNFESLFMSISLEDLIIGDFEKIQQIKKQIKSNGGIKENKYIKFLFNYTDLQPDVISLFFENHLDISTCYYCNIDFVNTYNTKSKKKNKFTLDHYYDKSTYPYLALSLYNFVPSCYTCNSKLKGIIEFTNLAPSSEKYDFEQKVKFKLFLDGMCQNLQIKSKKDIEIPLKENYSNDFKDYIEKLYLDERYRVHKDIVFEMIQNAELYPESRLKELQNLTGIPFQQIKKDIFNLIDENDDLSKKPFSKLIKDISEELGLV